jgi:trimethylamine--corrinoid protein Co-methyltransferase
VLHLQSPNVESQDIPVHLRHYQVTEAQLTLSRKPFFIFSRGSEQVEDAFAMARLAHGLSQQEFEAKPLCYTVINTNSPRQLDIPMCQGIIDFARAGQVSVITPFTLAGAMAPVTMPGALVLQHAEALAGILLSQIVRPGAPVVYGSFTSNVDMKSGSPAFGTPEFVQAAFGAGQLARHIGLPWRGSAATASNAPDEQAVYEFLMSAWGSILGGVNVMVHAAGWLEGGLTGSMEKFIKVHSRRRNAANLRRNIQSARQRRRGTGLRGDCQRRSGRSFFRLRTHHGSLPDRVLRTAGFRLE